MQTDFDELIDRRASDSLKWHRYGPNVLPLWVADMDFAAPREVIESLHERVDHGIFGYGLELPELTAAICSLLLQKYSWRVSPEAIVYLPGLVCGLNVAARAIGKPGDGILVNSPVYPPFLSTPANQDRELVVVEQTAGMRNGKLFYEMDLDRLRAAVGMTTRMFILCNPHNPTGRVYSRSELESLAALCLENDLIICSDEIHCDLILGGRRHIPIASLDPQIAEKTITLLAPSKTFNIPGLGCSFAVVPSEELRRKIQRAARGIVPEVNVLGMAASLSAYTHCAGWLRDLLEYLKGNRDFVVEFVTTQLPGVKCTYPEATYLAWLDCRVPDGPANPHRFFLDRAGVALNDGDTFGPGGKGFVRLNFGCPRSLLREALDRMSRAWKDGISAAG